MKKGFTLIELLVVISIIALLLAILMPALSKVKEKAMTMVCMSNQRQASLANIIYSTDNDGLNTPSWAQLVILDMPPQHWFTFLRPYISESKATILCPRAKKPDMSKDKRWGTATRAWYPDTSVHTYGEEDDHGGFGYNNWLEYDYDGDGKAILKQASAQQPSLVPAFGDCAWPDAGWVFETDQISLPEYRDDPYQDDPGTGYLKRFCLDRHDDAINIAFIDGHGEKTIDVDDLLKYRWHGKWNKSLITQETE